MLYVVFMVLYAVSCAMCNEEATVMIFYLNKN